MALAVIEGRRRRSVTRWLRGLWSYYRAYTGTAVHTASAAALAIFGLLVFVDPLFAVVAIASYVCPPVVLYVLGVDTHSSRPEPTVTETDASDGSSRRTTSGPAAADVGSKPVNADRRDEPGEPDGSDSDTDTTDGDSDSDTDTDDGDSDSDDRDTDTDTDG
ncbi:hypothetical protein [Natrialba sp. INN-245]|uniref:hypothetical protein n=1 Tax=Natrialba sp. INN-245 TaxID=2690967 RepID=UPI0013119DD1|nr:hypothetical protein [Natrialba sp. INN-245]MWV40771.1 hypothetical protein [Natrialba sp. INN-245]